MATGTLSGPITGEDLLDMPDDGIERWILRGELKEFPKEFSMTRRNRFHSEAMTKIATALQNWCDRQPRPRGKVLTGDAGFRLSRNPETTFGIDVAYIGPELAGRLTEEDLLVEGIPDLAVEILSPSDTQELIHQKIEAYLEALVPMVWILDPYDQTVRVYRPGKVPQLFTTEQELTAEHLVGLRIPVASVFCDA